MNNIISSRIKRYKKTSTSLTYIEKFRYVQLIICAFYSFIFFQSLTSFSNKANFFDWIITDPIWPIYWLNYVNTKLGIRIILWLRLVGGLVAVTNSNLRISRVFIFISLIEFYALKNTFGKVSHSNHLTMIICLILVFLPNNWNKIKYPQKKIWHGTINTFIFSQVFIMLTYSLSGIGKILGGIYQISLGEVHVFHPYALALHISDVLYHTNQENYFGALLVKHYYLGWPLMIGAIYLQLFSFFITYRPSLHRYWGISLILFHVGAYLTMGIYFWDNCYILAIFFIHSPFRPQKTDLNTVLLDLPLFGFLLSKSANFKSRILSR